MNYWKAVGLLMVYQVGRVVLGLAVHPYRTMRAVVRDKWEWPLILVPAGLLVALLVMMRTGAWLVDVPGGLRGWVAGGLAIGTIGLMLWQVELGYLGWRFRKIS